MADGRINLRDSILLANSILKASPMSLMLARAEDDALKLNLPPIIGGGASSMSPDAATLKVLATLYLQAELEQSGIIAVAEVLAENRYQFSIQNVQTANLLEEFFRKKRDWLDRNSREHIFARIFGIGSLVSRVEGALVNRDFQTKFANFCLELRRGGEDLRWRKPISPMTDAAIKQAATDLLFNLGSRGYGDVLHAARRIQTQLSKSIELLSNEGIGNALQTRGMWNVLRAILGENTPDFARLITRGQSGLQLLNWLAEILPLIADRNYRRPLLETNSPVINWAEMWLEATGLKFQETAFRRAA